MDAEGRVAGVVSQTAIGDAIRGAHAHAASRAERPTTGDSGSSGDPGGSGKSGQKVVR